MMLFWYIKGYIIDAVGSTWNEHPEIISDESNKIKLNQKINDKCS